MKKRQDRHISSLIKSKRERNKIVAIWGVVKQGKKLVSSSSFFEAMLFILRGMWKPLPTSRDQDLMPGALFRWRQELVRVSTCMYIPGPSGTALNRRPGAGKGGHTDSWSPAATAHRQAPSSPGQEAGPGPLARPAQAGEPVSALKHRFLWKAGPSLPRYIGCTGATSHAQTHKPSSST